MQLAPELVAQLAVMAEAQPDRADAKKLFSKFPFQIDSRASNPPIQLVVAAAMDAYVVP